jgi:hypothetical protein
LVEVKGKAVAGLTQFVEVMLVVDAAVGYGRPPLSNVKDRG